MSGRARAWLMGGRPGGDGPWFRGALGKEREQATGGQRERAGGIEDAEHGRDAPGDDVAAPAKRVRLEQDDVEREAHLGLELHAKAGAVSAKPDVEHSEGAGVPGALEHELVAQRRQARDHEQLAQP